MPDTPKGLWQREGNTERSQSVVSGNDERTCGKSEMFFFSYAEIPILTLRSVHVTHEMALGRFRKISLTDHKLRCVSPSVRMEKLSFHWTVFHEI